MIGTRIRALVALSCATGLLVWAGGAAPAVTRPTAAVVADPAGKAAAVADLVSAELSKAGHVGLVERAALKQILAEQKLQLAFGARGGDSRRRLGALLRAEYLVLLRVSGEDKSGVLEAVVAEARSGYRLARHAWPWRAESADATAAEAAAQFHDVLARFRRGVRAAVAIPPFFSRDLTHRFDHLQAAYAQVVELEAARRPGCVAVELEEARAIAEELALGAGDDQVMRPMPHYITGEFRHATPKPDAPVAITMRLERKGRELSTATAEGLDEAAALAFVRTAAEGMLDAVLGERAPAGARDAAQELRILLARADSFLAVNALDEAAALYEAAALLDPQNVSAREGAYDAYTRLVATPTGFQRRFHATDPVSDERRKVARHKVSCTLRGTEHLARLLRLEKDQTWKWLSRHVGALWHAMELQRYYGLLAGLPEEVEQLERAKRHFLVHDLPLSWREEGWPDYKAEKEDYTRSWLRQTAEFGDSPWLTRIYVFGDCPHLDFPEPEWFEFQLQLYQAVYKGKTRWYARWVTLPPSCGNGDLEKQYGEEKVREYKRLHAQAKEKFKRLCDDKVGLDLALRYAHLAETYGYALGEPNARFWRKPGFVALLEMERLRFDCLEAGIIQAALDCERMVESQTGRYRAHLPRFSPARPERTKPHVQPREEPAGGRVVAEPLSIEFFRKDGTSKGGQPRWRSTGFSAGICGVVPCGEGTDAFWAPGAISIMREKGKVIELHADPELCVTDVCWDGRWLWAGTKQGQVLLLDPGKGLARTIGQDDGLPGAGMGMMLCVLAPGRLCAVDSLPPHARAWCAVVTAEGKVSVFHEARRQASEGNDVRPDIAFKPKWIFAVRRPDGKTVDQVLVGRDGLGASQYSLDDYALVIDPQTLKVDTHPSKLPEYSCDFRTRDIAQAGEFLFIQITALRLDDLSRHTPLRHPIPSHPLGRDRTLLQVGDRLLMPGDDSFKAEWFEVNPKTLMLTKLKGTLPRANHPYYLFRSWHYGILAHNLTTTPRFWRVVVEP